MSSPSTKDTTQASQTANKTALAASPIEQEKLPATNDATPDVVEAPAAATNYQAPVSSSEKPPLPPSDPTPDPPATKLDADADADADDEDVEDPELKETEPAGARPRVPDLQERRRRAKLLIIHTRLSKFFAWILLLGFVILPGTFRQTDKIRDVPLLALGFVCSMLNAFTTLFFWRLRKSNIEWLFTNLFFAGFVNSFSGMITTFVNIYGVQGGPHGAPTKSTIALTSTFTLVYGILTLIYFRKRTQLRKQRSSRVSSVV